MRKILSILLIFTSVEVALAQTANVPVELQVPLLMKSLLFEKSLVSRCGQEVNLGILHSETDSSNFISKEFKEIVDSLYGEDNLQGLPINAYTFKELDFDTALKSYNINILYLCPEFDSLDYLIERCKTYKILTVTGEATLVEKGVILGFGVKPDNKPQIIINVTAAKETGIEFLPSFLNLAKTIW